MKVQSFIFIVCKSNAFISQKGVLSLGDYKHAYANVFFVKQILERKISEYFYTCGNCSCYNLLAIISLKTRVRRNTSGIWTLK